MFSSKEVTFEASEIFRHRLCQSVCLSAVCLWSVYCLWQIQLKFSWPNKVRLGRLLDMPPPKKTRHKMKRHAIPTRQVGSGRPVGPTAKNAIFCLFPFQFPPNMARRPTTACRVKFCIDNHSKKNEISTYGCMKGKWDKIIFFNPSMEALNLFFQ